MGKVLFKELHQIDLFKNNVVDVIVDLVEFPGTKRVDMTGKKHNKKHMIKLASAFICYSLSLTEVEARSLFKVKKHNKFPTSKALRNINDFKFFNLPGFYFCVNNFFSFDKIRSDILCRMYAYEVYAMLGQYKELKNCNKKNFKDKYHYMVSLISRMFGRLIAPTENDEPTPDVHRMFAQYVDNKNDFSFKRFYKQLKNIEGYASNIPKDILEIEVIQLAYKISTLRSKIPTMVSKTIIDQKNMKDTICVLGRQIRNEWQESGAPTIAYACYNACRPHGEDACRIDIDFDKEEDYVCFDIGVSALLLLAFHSKTGQIIPKIKDIIDCK